MLEDAHNRSPEELLAHYGVSAASGLTPAQVLAARRAHGRNAVPEEPPPSFAALLWAQADDTLVRILLAAAAVDFALSLADGDAPLAAAVEPSIILLILIANALVGALTERHANAAISALRTLQAETAAVLRAGALAAVAAEELVPGDIVELTVGDRVPADCALLSLAPGHAALRVDQSIVTGESGSVEKVAGALALPPRAVAQDKTNTLFGGTVVVAGRCRALAVGTGTASAIGRIQRALADESGAADATPLRRKLDAFGDLLSRAIAGICVAVWLVSVPRFVAAGHGSWLQGALYYFKSAVALAVAAIPEGLPAVVTTCLALGARKMARRNAIVRTLPSVETLGCTTVICVDKTGTLTSNAMAVVRAAVPTSAGLEVFEVDGAPMAASGGVRRAGAGQRPLLEPATVPSLVSAAMCGSLCNDATLSRDVATGAFTKLGEATEAALHVFAQRVGIGGGGVAAAADGRAAALASAHWRAAYPRLGVLPFDRERKLMTVAVEAPDGGGVLAFTKGAPERVLPRCRFALDDAGEASVEMDESRRAAVAELEAVWGGEHALRCVALAYRALPPHRAAAGRVALAPADEADLVFVGLVGMHDPPRPEAAPAVAQCQAAGIRVMMLTGDSQPTAEAVARAVGILRRGEGRHARFVQPRGHLGSVATSLSGYGAPRGKAGGGGVDGAAAVSLTAAEFEELDGEAQVGVVQALRVLSRVEPHHKRSLIEALKEQGEVVAMTGDGVNDAPALRRADIGIAMGSGTAVARQSADMVLADDSLATVVAAVGEGRAMFDNARQFIRYMVSSNIGEVVVLFVAAAAGLPTPLSPVQLLWVNLVTDGLPATALSFNAPDGDVMRARPRRRDEGLVDRWLVVRYAVIGAYVGGATLWATVHWFLAYPGGPRLSWAALRATRGCGALSAAALASADLAAACDAVADPRPATVATSVLVVVEMFNALNAVSENSSLLVHPPWRNVWLLGAIALTMLLHLAVMHVPALAATFGVTPLSGGEWSLVLGVAAPVVLVDEALKAASRRGRARGAAPGGAGALGALADACARTLGLPRTVAHYARVAGSPKGDPEREL